MMSGDEILRFEPGIKEITNRLYAEHEADIDTEVYVYTRIGEYSRNRSRILVHMPGMAWESWMRRAAGLYIWTEAYITGAIQRYTVNGIMDPYLITAEAGCLYSATA